jgi:aminopeptidase N
MNRIVLLVLITLFAYTLVNAQAAEYCAAGKVKHVSALQRKLRAGASDNALMGKYNVTYYYLTINASNTSLYLSGNTLIKAKVNAATILDSFCFELHANHIVDSVLINGTPATVVRIADIGYAIPSTPLSANSFFTAQVFYGGNAPTGNQSAIDNGYNIDQSPSWGNYVSWSLSQPYSAYHWFACKQHLTDKADSSRVDIITADSLKSGSNGVLLGIDTLPNGKLIHKWFNKEPINYYLISIATAKYINYEFNQSLQSGGSVLMQNYVYNNPGTLNNFKTQIDLVGPMINYLDSLLVPYPYKHQKYGHCMAPFTGGMEHQTMTSLGFFNFGLDAHELMHQWFGDYVTCSTWHDIMINEGFASYGEYLLLNRLQGYNAAQADMADVHTNVMTQTGGSVYCPDTANVNRIFSSRLSYNKGNAVIHTLRFILGDAVFFNVLRQFLQTYKNGNASIDNLQTIAQTISGKNLNNYFDQWIYGEGYPTYNIAYNANGYAATLVITHSTSAANTTPTFTTPLAVRIAGVNTDTTVVFNIKSNSDTFSIPFKGTINVVQIDPANWVINKDGNISPNTSLIPTSIIEPQLTTLYCYPNPNSGEVLYCNKVIQQISVYNYNGQLLLSNSNTHFVNIAALPQGIYLAELTDKAGNKVVQKIIKQ